MKDISNIIIGGRKLKANEFVGSVDKILTQNLYSVLDKIGASLADEFAKNAPVSSGNLASNISRKILANYHHFYKYKGIRRKQTLFTL
jgi:hypothetical protein